jgi:hypothetical protein
VPILSFFITYRLFIAYLEKRILTLIPVKT